MNTKELFKLAFGTEPIAVEGTMQEKKYYSDFGFELVHPVIFEGGKYKTRLHTNKNPEVVDMPTFLLPATTLVDFSRSKYITKTDRYGGQGSVKEIFGFDDWMIRIRMLCITERSRNMKAHDIADMVIKFAELGDVIRVRSSIFLDKDIKSVVIENIDVKTIEGSPNVIPIELQCVSALALESILIYD